MLKKPFIWYGGKGPLAKKIAALIPRGGLPYVEPYAGSASVFFALPPAPVEVLNDLDGFIVNFYRVMQNWNKYTELKHRLTWTPVSRAEWKRACEMLEQDGLSDIDYAWAFYVAANQSFSGAIGSGWLRTISESRRGMALHISRWLSRLESFDTFRLRLAHAQVDCTDALKCIQYWDNTNAVFYVDPPYIANTRVDEQVYRHEASDDHHHQLVDLLLQCKGAVVLSGYASPIHSRLEEAGWKRVDFAVPCNASKRARSDAGRSVSSRRTESVWCNRKAVERAWMHQISFALDDDRDER